MDDVHNLRLRERPKKENSNAHVVQGLSPSGLASVSRSKRKRQGSQEIHDQARNTTVDDIDETTEDTEMDISDDDDDPPPPPIPRRAVKFRPQGKVSHRLGELFNYHRVPCFLEAGSKLGSNI